MTRVPARLGVGLTCPGEQEAADGRQGRPPRRGGWAGCPTFRGEPAAPRSPLGWVNQPPVHADALVPGGVVRKPPALLIPRAGGSLRLSPPVSAAQDAERPLDGLESASVSALAMPWRTGTERHPQERAESEVGPCPLGTHLTPTHPEATSRSTRTAHPNTVGAGLRARRRILQVRGP